MDIFSFPQAKGIVVSGDIHGDFKQLVHKCCIQYGMTDTLIIVAGDCGFGFHSPDYYENIYLKIHSRLATANNWIVFVRGNHDNPAYFDGKQVNRSRWKAVPDYSVLKACDHTILCVGGAVSIDRCWRIYDNYWPDERPVYDQVKLDTINDACSIDAVVTHTAPSFCEKISQDDIRDWLMKDEKLFNDIKRERKVMDDIHTCLRTHNHPLQEWYYGHFHESWHQEIEGVKYHMLDCGELREMVMTGWYHR